MFHVSCLVCALLFNVLRDVIFRRGRLPLPHATPKSLKVHRHIMSMLEMLLFERDRDGDGKGERGAKRRFFTERNERGRGIVVKAVCKVQWAGRRRGRQEGRHVVRHGGVGRVWQARKK